MVKSAGDADSVLVRLQEVGLTYGASRPIEVVGDRERRRHRRWRYERMEQKRGRDVNKLLVSLDSPVET